MDKKDITGRTLRTSDYAVNYLNCQKLVKAEIQQTSGSFMNRMMTKCKRTFQTTRYATLQVFL
ncbi:hypothetical protein D3Z62_11865 [Lachnospiraceae bacterium]|nr:hypothetical protein [Lachnospiraceae bacterium]